MSETVDFTFSLQEAELTLATLEFVYGRRVDRGGPAAELIRRFRETVSDERNIVGIQQAGHSIVGGQSGYWCTHDNCDTWQARPDRTLRGAYEEHLAWLTDHEMWELL